MAARAIWKGTIAFGAVECPVKLYSAVEDRTVHFRLLHDRDRAPVKQKLVDRRTHEEVEDTELRRGAAVTRTRYVIVSGEELESVEPKPSRTISVSAFVPSAAIDPALYVRPYWLGPDGSGPIYAAIVEALRRQKREGIAHWVMRNRAFAGALRATGNHLMLVTLRHAGETVAASEIRVPAGRQSDPKELAMARQLLSMLEGSFDASEYRDEYRERVLDLIRKKAAGHKLVLERPAEKQPARDLRQALEKSLAAASSGARKRQRAKERAHG